MSKYRELNAVFGEPSAFNDKIVNGRSLKWYVEGQYRCTVEDMVEKCKAIPYVRMVSAKHDYVRVHISNI